jgi:hypothetical protein
MNVGWIQIVLIYSTRINFATLDILKRSLLKEPKNKDSLQGIPEAAFISME